MAAYDDQHFSPTLANRWWAKDGRHYVCYFADGAGSVSVNSRLGKTKWGKERRLWSTDVEQALNRELETPAARIYQGLVEEARVPVGRERVKWAQFLMSQVVRTPTFIRYEKWPSSTTASRAIPITIASAASTAAT